MCAAGEAYKHSFCAFPILPHRRDSIPARKDRLAARSLDLLSKTAVIESQQCVVRLIRRAAKRISRKHNAVTEVDRVEHCGQNTDIGFGTGDDETVCSASAQQRR